MSYHDLLILVGGLGICSTLGMIGLLLKIKQTSRLSHNPNVLRRGDIELNDYIHPTQPHIPREFDIIDPIVDPIQSLHVHYPQPIYERISTVPSFHTGALPPTYRSGTLPYYQSVDNFNINCILENENIINQEFIIIFVWFFLVFLTIILFKNSIILRIKFYLYLI